MLAAAFIALFCSLAPKAPYTCGQKEYKQRRYGTVELRVNCDYVKRTGRIVVLEYKGDIQHGFQIAYDTSWRKLDSAFFRNGKEEGLGLFWDTLGNVIGRVNYKRGKTVGREEYYWAPGKPSAIKNYNVKGEADGLWEEWWRTGNKKAEFMAKNGEIVSGTEYFPDGKRRISYALKYEPLRKSFLEGKYIHGEAWTPNGKSTGKIVNGSGEWTRFSVQPDSMKVRYNAVRESYRDSLMVNLEELDSAGVASWLKQ